VPSKPGSRRTRLEIFHFVAVAVVVCSLLFGERLDTLLRHRIREYPDSPVHTLSESLRIYFFPLWRADLFFPDSLSNSPDTCAVAVSGKKKFRIRKYPDTCGRGLIRENSLHRRNKRKGLGQPWLTVESHCFSFYRHIYSNLLPTDLPVFHSIVRDCECQLLQHCIQMCHLALV